MNYLFVCRANMSRSPKAAEWLQRYAFETGLELEADSAGIEVHAMPNDERYFGRKRLQIDRALCDWADRIFVMEGYMTSIINGICEQDGKIVNMEIPDNFDMSTQNDDIPVDITPAEAVDYMKLNPDADINEPLFYALLEAKVGPHLEAARK